MILFDYIDDNDVVILNGENIKIKEEFERVSRLVILNECDSESLTKLEDKTLASFFEKFLKFKIELTDEKLLEQLNQRTGYDFSYKEE